MFDLYVRELSDLVREFPGFKPTPKKGSLLCLVLGAALWVLTFGRSEFSHYYTVIGKTLYTGDGWDRTPWDEKVVLLRHERRHLEQARSCGFGLFWLGWVVWSFSYLFLLPVGITMRGYWERQAYAVTVSSCRSFGIPVDREWLISQFTGPQYLYMEIRRKYLERWFDHL